MEQYYVGADVGGTTVKLGLFSEQGKLLDQWEIPTNKDNNGSNILPDVAASVKEKANEHHVVIEGIGVGVPGPVTEDGVVLKCANLGWDVFSVEDKVRELTGIEKVKVGNDANVAALGEMWKGGGEGFQSIVMVTLGTGVGGGVILNGKILTGSKGAGGEIGHTKVEYNEEDTCGCGNHGCLEQYASATGIVRMAHKELEKKHKSVGHLSAKTIFDAAKAGDSFYVQIVEKFGLYLGTALSNVACVVDPDAFVIGGGVSKAGQIIIDLVEKYYNQKAMFALRNKKIVLAKLGNDAGIYGCAKLVMGV